MQEEMLDIVDKNDQVLYSLPRSEVYKKNLCSQMRSVWLLLKNEKGQLWIPRRAFNRERLPGHLDGSVVGHVQAGESYEQALFREAIEEVGISMHDFSYKLLGKLTPEKDDVFCFATVYEAEIMQEPQAWSRIEFMEWFWLYPQEILQRVDDQDKVKDTLPIIIKKFYS